MNGACTAASGAPSLARDILASTDCFIATRVEQAYGQLLAPGGSFSTTLTIALTIYVAVYGYRLALGRATLSLGDLVPRFIRIGLVLAVVTSWPTYQHLVFDLMFSGPQDIAQTVMVRSDSRNPDDVVTALQRLFDRMTGYAGDAWGQHGTATNAVAAGPPTTGEPTSSGPTATTAPTVTPPAAGAAAMPFALGPPQFVAMALWASALLILATNVGLLLVVRIILAVLLIFGPVFIALALFAPTRSVFEGWLRATVKFALVPLVVLPLAAVAVAVLTPFVGALAPGPITTFRDTPALSILIIALVFAAVLSQALALTGTIAGAIRLPRERGTAAVDADGMVTAPLLLAGSQPSRAEVIAAMVPVTAVARADSSARAAGDLVDNRRILPATGRAVAPADVGGRLGHSFRTTAPRIGFASNLRTTLR